MSDLLNNPMYLELIANIDLARKKRGWTQQEFCKRAGFSRRSYGQLVGAKVVPSLDILVKALNVLDLAEGLFSSANPEKDRIGLDYDRRRLGRKPSSDDDELLDF